MKGMVRDVAIVQQHLLLVGCGEAKGIKPGFSQSIKSERRRKRESRQEDELGILNTEVDVAMGTPASCTNPGLLFSGLCLSDRNINFHLVQITDTLVFLSLEIKHKPN